MVGLSLWALTKMKTTRSLGRAWLSLLLLLRVGSATAVTLEAMRRPTTGRVTYLTPGCKNTGSSMKEHVGMCARDSIVMKVDGQIAVLLDQKPWAVGGLPDMDVDRRRHLQTLLLNANPDLLFYTPATMVVGGPIYVQNITVGGYFKVGNITLGPDSDLSALQGLPG